MSNSTKNSNLNSGTRMVLFERKRILKMFEIEYRPYKSEGQNNWKGEVKTYRVKIVNHYGSEAEGSNIGYVGINEDGQIRRFNYHQIINMSHVGR